MKVRKVLAGGLAVAAAGATLAFGALAASSSLGDYVQIGADKMSLSSPLIVIGNPGSAIGPQYPMDVAGAADIAAAVAGYATTPITVGGGVTAASVTGGADLSTSNTKIYYGDSLTKSGLRSTMTVNNLPTLLATGTFYDSSGNAFSYNQYLNFGAGTVSFSTDGGDFNDPALYLDTGTSTATPLFNMSVTFNKLLNLSDSSVQGQPIELFGKQFTIGSSSEYDANGHTLVLFGGAGNSQTIAEGQDVTVTVNGVSHDVKVIGVSSATIAVISVDGVSKSVNKGSTYTISGVDVYIDDIYSFTKESQLSQVKLSLGSNKLTLNNGDSVKIGQSEDSIDGTLVTLTGTNGQGISKLDISVTAKDSSSNFITPTQPFTDPVFNAVNVAFGGLNTGTTDTIVVDNSGNNGANLKFTDYRGNEKTIIWAYTSSQSFTPMLNDSSTKTYHVVEGDTVPKNDYVLLAPVQESEFGHIMQYTASSSLGNSGSYIELKDVMSGDTTRIYLTDTAGGSANAAGTFYVDGQQYFVNVTSISTGTLKFSWGAGAAEGNAGTQTMLFPLIKTENGEYVTFINKVTVANGTTVFLPGDTVSHLVTNGSTITAGRLSYTFTNSAGSAVLTAVNGTGAGVDLTTAPAVLVLEQKGKDITDTDQKDAILVTIANGGTVPAPQVKVQQPILTAGTQGIGFVAQSTDASVSEIYDRYGVHVVYDSDNQGTATMTVPQDQALAMVAAGDNPQFSVGNTTAGTYNAAIQIKSPITKLDSEVTTPSSLQSDVILLGGPCANSLVATLLSSQTPAVTCGNWTYSTGIIQEVSNAFGSGHKALIVAGTQGTDTRALADKVMQGTLSFSQ